jgi:hypothetical protein
MTIHSPEVKNNALSRPFSEEDFSDVSTAYPPNNDIRIDIGETASLPNVETTEIPATRYGYKLLSPHLQALSAIAVSETFETSFSENPRRHQLVRVAIPGQPFHDGLWNSPPSIKNDNPLYIANILGLGEIIEGGLARSYHEHLSHELPAAYIDTHSTRGVGTTGDRMSLKELWSYGLEEMARDRFDLFCNLYGNNPLVIAATSLNSAIAVRIAKLNIDAGEPLRITALIAYASALTEPKHTFYKMGALPGALIIDGGAELLIRSNSQTRNEVWTDMLHSKPKRADVAPIVRQGSALFRRGTPRALTSEVANHYRENFIEMKGSLDTLNEDHANLPITQVRIEGRAHCIVLNAVKRARSVAKILKRTGVYQPIIETEVA